MRKILLIAVLITAMAGVVFAQSMPNFDGGAQNVATQGRYRSNADNFIRPDSYAGVSFNTFFSMASFASTTNAQLGFATKIDSLYLAVAYAGNFWSGITDFTYTERNTDQTTWVAALPWTGDPKTFRDYGANTNFGAGTIMNNVAILIGVADMGFRLTYSSTHEALSETDLYTTARGFQKSYNAERGYIQPQIAWSMAKDLTEIGIKPWVTLAPRFVRNNSSGETYVNDGTSNGTQIYNSQDYFRPQFDAGLGGVILFRNESGFRLSADLDYRLILEIYENNYSYWDAGTYYTKTISGGRNVNNTTFSEYSTSQNIITPSLSGQWSGGPLALRFKFNLPVTLTSTDETPLVREIGAPENMIKTGTAYSQFAFGFQPNLQLAMQWKAIANRLTVNAGALINLNNIGVTTRDNTTYDVNGDVVDNSSTKVVTNASAATQNQLTLGVTFTPTDNFSIEAVCGSTIPLTGNNINVFSTGGDGLFNFGQILVSLKF